MRPADRIILIGTLTQALWMIVDGVRCVVNGHYQSRVLTVVEALSAEGVVVELGDGRFVEYGPWAFLPSQLGIHPHALAPLFVGLGIAGMVALGLYLGRKPAGWFALVAFSVGTLWYAVFGTLVSALVLVMLLLPSTRRDRLGPVAIAPSPPATE